MKAFQKIAVVFFFSFFWLCSGGQDRIKIDSLELAIQVSKEPQQKVDLFIALAEEYKTNLPDKAAALAATAMKIADSIPYPAGQLSSWRLLADIYRRSSDYQKALDFAGKAMESANELGDEKEKAAIFRIFGLIFSDLGNYEESSKYFFESLKINEKLGDKENISQALNGIGYLFFEQEQYLKALEYYANALAISREINDPIGIARGLNNIAAVYGNRNDFENVRRFLFEAIAINRKTGQRYWEGINYMNLGSVNLDEEILDSAYFYFNKSIRIFEELGHMLLLSNALIGLSQCYLLEDSLTQSEASARLAFRIGSQHHLKKVTVDAAAQLHRLFDATRNIDSAHYYGILHYQLKDSLQIEQSVTRLAQMELMYEFEKINQEKQIREKTREFTYLIIVISLLFVMIVGFILASSKHKLRAKTFQHAREQLESELEMKNKELAYNVMTLMKKNEVLSGIANKLMEVQEEAVRDETKSAIRKIARDLQKTGDEEIWKEFETRFKQVHGEFYRNLLQKFPDLSPNEQKLCAFLRLNMSTKEISELTGQRVSTLEIARSRLRKKLGLSNSPVNLVTFLSTI